MATLPSANTTLTETQNALSGGTGAIVVMAATAQSADFVPRQVSSIAALLSQYGYSQGAAYAALHINETDQPVVFVGMPIVTQGTISQVDNTGVTGTCQITLTAGSSGPLEECNVVWTTTQGSLVGTDQILGTLSLDGGVSSQPVRLGANTSYAIPYVGLTLNFVSGSTLNVGDVWTAQTTAPMWGSTAMSSARQALAGQQLLARSWLAVGDCPSSVLASTIITEANNYETANQRFVYARGSVQDRLPLGKKSKQFFRAVGNPSLTFAATGHTITRATGSFVTDGFAIGQIVTVAGSVLNNGTIGVLTGVSATVLTFGSGVVNEGPLTGVTVSASETITFASTTATRSTGSWITDGFAIGQQVTVTGTTSNNVTVTISGLSATVLTVASGFASEGPIVGAAVSVVQAETLTAWIAAEASAFATITGTTNKRIDLSAGKGRVQCPITGYFMRRPAGWHASVREYQHDVQIPSWRKDDGPLSGVKITDANGNIVEFDERYIGGALAGQFTCLRSYANDDPGTAYVAMSLTRDADGNLLSRTHNLAVANLCQTVVQKTCTKFIGQVLILNDDGTATTDSLQRLAAIVNRQLQINLLQKFSEGPRASSAVWTPSATDILNTTGATLNGVCALNLNGTLEHINTSIVVN